MLRWLFGSKLKRIVENDIVDARLMLTTMKLKLHKEGNEATRMYGEGVGEVAGLLAQRFKISVPDALAGQNLDWRQLDDASRDLSGAMDKTTSLLKSQVQSARSLAHKQGAGCLVLYHLYRMRFLSHHAPQEQRAEAAAMADRLSRFIRTMAEVGAGIRDPEDAQT